MLFEGDIDCVKRLLMPVERILKVGRDIYREGYDKRLSLWKEVEEHYDWYLSGECGNPLSDLDKWLRESLKLHWLCWPSVSGLTTKSSIREGSTMMISLLSTK